LAARTAGQDRPSAVPDHLGVLGKLLHRHWTCLRDKALFRDSYVPRPFWPVGYEDAGVPIGEDDDSGEPA